MRRPIDGIGFPVTYEAHQMISNEAGSAASGRCASSSIGPRGRCDTCPARTLARVGIGCPRCVIGGRAAAAIAVRRFGRELGPGALLRDLTACTSSRFPVKRRSKTAAGWHHLSCVLRNCRWTIDASAPCLCSDDHSRSCDPPILPSTASDSTSATMRIGSTVSDLLRRGGAKLVPDDAHAREADADPAARLGSRPFDAQAILQSVCRHRAQVICIDQRANGTPGSWCAESGRGATMFAPSVTVLNQKPIIARRLFWRYGRAVGRDAAPPITQAS
jgi:hypothetical protein